MKELRRPLLAKLFLTRLGLCAAICTPLSCRPRTVEVPQKEDVGRVDAELLPVNALQPDVQWRQRVTASWDGGERSFGAVLSKGEGALQLLGLDPMGRVGFRLSLRDGQPIQLEKHPSLQFPFDPRYIVLDVQRIYYPWLAPAAVPPSGEISGRVAGTFVTERYREGRIVERIFAAPGRDESSEAALQEGAEPAPTSALAGSEELGTAELEARVRYAYDSEFGLVPAQAVYENLRHGYRLTIETLDVAELEP